MNDSDLLSLITDAKRQTEGRARLRDLLDAAGRTLAYAHWLNRLPQAAERLPVALLSSFTLQTIEPFLQVEAYLSGWRPQTTYTQYSQWQSALLAPATLGACRAVVLVLHEGALMAAATPDALDPMATLSDLVAAFRNASALPLFVACVAAPPERHALALGWPAGKGPVQRHLDIQRGLMALAGRTRDMHLMDLRAETLRVNDWFDERGYFTTHSVFARAALPAVARVIARCLACLFTPRRKVLVMDLDNSLWGGVAGEDGVLGLDLESDYPGAAYVAFQRQLLALRRSGVLLAMASKNNEADARAVFEQRSEMALAWADFSAFRVNWVDKAHNITEMADELGLGLDAFVFADDSAIECALVRAALPEVEVVELGSEPARFMDKVLRCQAFDVLHISAEDRGRAESYAAEAGRRSLRGQVTDMASFLASCELRLSLQAVNHSSLERVHQLLGKTNQFNFTLERPAKEQLAALCLGGSGGQRLFAASLQDRFGQYGLIGVLHIDVQAETLLIHNLALSCRALGRGVEDALLAFARERAQQAGCTTLRVNAARGPRNQQIFEYLDKRGFARLAETESGVPFVCRALRGSLPWPAYLSFESPAQSTGTAHA